MAKVDYFNPLKEMSSIDIISTPTVAATIMDAHLNEQLDVALNLMCYDNEPFAPKVRLF